MHCPNCGTQNQDNALACSQCGTAFNHNPNPVPQRLLDKKEYFETIASDKTKMMRKVALIVGIVALVFTIVTAFITTNVVRIYNIPIFGMLSDEFEDIEEEYDEFLEEWDDLSDYQIERLENEYNADIDDIRYFFEHPTFSNFAELANKMADEDVIMGLNVINYAIYGYALFVALFQLLAVLLKKSGLVIAAIIISIPYFAFFAGLWMWLIFLLLNISQLTIYINANKEYKNYKRSLLNQY